MSRADHLGPKLGPVLLQLPANFRINLEALDETLSLFPGHAPRLEPRHDSWHCNETADLLARHQAAFCLSDAPGRRSRGGARPTGATSDCMKVGPTPAPCYGRTAACDRGPSGWPIDGHPMRTSTCTLTTTAGPAPSGMHTVASNVERVGLEPSRVPSAREVRVGAARPRDRIPLQGNARSPRRQSVARTIFADTATRGDTNIRPQARCAARAARAALAPHAPCTPPPGWAEDGARYRPRMGVSDLPSPGMGRKTSCWWMALVPPLMAPPTRLASWSSRSPGHRR